VASIQLSVNNFVGAVDYAFCLRELKFLNGEGEEVRACAASGG